MSQKDNFSGGFILGSIVGGIVGGLLGTALAGKINNKSTSAEKPSLKAGTEPKFNLEENTENTRRSLEDKIAQLNTAIDDVRQQLSSVDRDRLDN